MPAPDLLEACRTHLQHHFGYSDFRPLQSRVVAALVGGRDVLAVLPTGAGKSICFQVPALLQASPTLVVSPLISLMQDQVAAAQARGIAAAALNSAMARSEQRATMDALLAGSLRLLYVSPERLSRLAPELQARMFVPGFLAVDEAHCISEWGPDFRPAYRTLRRLRGLLGWPPVIALTGSATADVRHDIIRSLGLGRSRTLTTVLGSFDRRNLWFGVTQVCSEAERLQALLGALKLQDAMAIVYAPTRSLTEELARVLAEAGFRSAPYHAGLSTEARRAVLTRFLEDDVGVVVATCAFGMGIDKPDVRLVVHWTLPPTPEAYYQEAGRAGRDGRLSRCVLLFRKGDGLLPRRQLDVTFPQEAVAERFWKSPDTAGRVPENVKASLERLRHELKPERGPVDWRGVRRRRQSAESRIEVVERYAKDRRCRRATLIGYFGERIVRCAGCDVCSARPPLPLPRGQDDARLARLRRALAHAQAPWGGALLDAGTLRRVAVAAPVTEQALASIEGVGTVVARRFGRTILEGLR